MIGNPLLLGPEGYQISRSVRLRSSASAFFNRTPGSAGNRQRWTYSKWIKRGTVSVQQVLLSSTNSSNDAISFTSGDNLQIQFANQTAANIITSQVFRDPSAWYHIVISVDTTQATASNRVLVYINGTQVTAFGTSSYPSQNYQTWINGAFVQNIGQVASVQYFDGYLTDINFIDGQALTPSSFGETDVLTGVWKPKKYAGTYGTNGFYLNFSDPSAATATAIGKDYSGNGNNWTPNNISVTAGSTYDSMLDVPTLWADGGNGRGNYCVWNALSRIGTPTNSAANLQTNLAAGSLINGSMVVSSGKWYYETQFTSGADAFMGWNRVDLQTGTGNAFQQAGSLLYFSSNGNRYKDGDGGATYGASYTTSDAIGCAIDLDNNQVTWYKNNVAQSTISIIAGNYAPCLATGGTACNFLSNFGQRPFAYTPPTGFKALNTQNLPEPTIRKGNSFFDVSLYTGNAGSITVTNAGFQPDLVWVKARSSAFDHKLVDSARGASGGIYYDLSSNSTGAESLPGAGVNGLTSTGFTIGGGTNNGYNGNGTTFAAWQWREGATQGFDIVTYTGNGSASQVVNHSLGVAPNFVIVKNRSASASWNVWGSQGFTRLGLNITNGDLGNYPITRGSSSITLPSTSDVGWNSNGNNYVAYLFSEVAGFSRFGSYTGNSSTDGPFCFTGFRPRWVMIKNTTSATGWEIYDTSRIGFNEQNNVLRANESSAEITFSGRAVDLLSNGFKVRSGDTPINASGNTYVYAAFAENPFRNSLAR